MYIVTPSVEGRFGSLPKLLIDETSPLKALKNYLEQYNISYNNIERLGIRKIKEMYCKGLSPMQVVSHVDFVVMPVGAANQSSGGNYRLN